MELIRIPKVENVRMLDRYSKKASQGTFYLTATHLIFVDHEAEKETWILHMHISTIEKLPLTTVGSPLLIRTKTFQSITFVIPKEKDCHDIYLSLKQLSLPHQFSDLYCFSYKLPTTENNTSKLVGWNFFDLQSEYQRMGVPNEQWALTKLNENYELCDTYPKYLYVPASATKTTLRGCSAFRSKGRLPVLTYLHSNKSSISRCSQPLSGFSARCVEDEKMFNHLLRTNSNASFMYVVDTRPKINAMANRATGKGYENEAFYENIKFHFLGVENIHVMRNSLLKVIDTCEQKQLTMNSFLNGLESSGWLKHIKSILDTSLFIRDAIHQGVSVVVHCSDGWDRTAQVCSIASLLLDPYYRTISGYQALIEKDWLAFGHKFSERCGHIESDPKEISPIFTQFLDCTWQLIEQFPCAFQFNETFLVTVHDHVHSCQYGTFVGNCEKDRDELRLNELAYSLWRFMAKHLDEYINPLYEPNEFEKILNPQLMPQNIRFWRGMYYRFESGVHPKESMADLLLATSDHSFSLDDHVKYLTKSIVTVKNLITKTMDRNKSKSNNKMNNSSTDNVYLGENSLKSSQDDNYIDDNNLEVEQEENAGSISKMNEITKNLESVAIDWKTLRDVNECSCSSAFDPLSKKSHCRRCGDIFCVRCVTKQVTLPGHATQKTVPVCKLCYDLLGSNLEG